jgi:Matrixin
LSHPVRTAVVAGLATALISGALTAAAAVPLPQDPAPPDAASAASARLRAQVTSSARLPRRGAVVVPSGSRVTMTVRLGRPGRTAHLQVRAQRWTTVATARSGRAGRASLRVPTRSTGRSSYRVLVPTRHTASEISRTVVVAVRTESDLTTAPETTEPADQVAGPTGPADAYTLFDTGRPGSVFRWDPCRPVRYRVHLGEAPAHLAAVVTRAVGRLSAATGLTFEDLGATAYTGSAGDPTQAGWPADTDLLLTVAGERDVPELAGAPVGYASLHRSAWSGADARIQRAEVVLEREYLRPGDSTGADAGAVSQLVLHELGHAVGLAHSADRTQVMYPRVGGDRLDYQAGDLSGLARVGAGGGCLV